MPDMRFIVAGAGGRMGRTLVRTVAETPGTVLAGAVEQPGSAWIGQDSGVLAGITHNGIPVLPRLDGVLDQADAILDFTSPAATVSFAKLAAGTGKVHVIGTTGLSGDDEAVIADAARTAVV